jgi:arylsulfatase A-like enzyme
VVAPGVRPRVENTPVDVALDLAASVVDWAGIEPPPSYDGVSLLPALEGDEAALQAMRRRVIPLARRSDSIGAVYDRFKYMKIRDAISLFDLEADPAEKRNVVGEHAELARSVGSVAEAEIARRTASYRNRRKSQAAVEVEDDDEH